MAFSLDYQDHLDPLVHKASLEEMENQGGTEWEQEDPWGHQDQRASLDQRAELGLEKEALLGPQGHPDPQVQGRV